MRLTISALFGLARIATPVRFRPSRASNSAGRSARLASLVYEVIMSGHYSRPLSCSSSESRPRRLKVVGVSLRSQLKGERLTNHTVSGDVESRPFTASIPNLLIARGRYQHAASQESYNVNFVPKRDLTRYFDATPDCLCNGTTVCQALSLPILHHSVRAWRCCRLRLQVKGD
jgi:hypothetical protein